MSIYEYLRKNKNHWSIRPIWILKNTIANIRRRAFGFFPTLYTSSPFYSRNNLELQKKHWRESFLKESTSEMRTGFGWGKIEPAHISKQRYENVKKQALAWIDQGSVVVDIGCYDGFWEEHLLEKNPTRIYCVDIFEDAKLSLLDRFGTEKIAFYKTEGNELRGIPDHSVDLIFSMDSLIRAEPEHIHDYFKEFRRVLKKNGRIMIHLPCLESALSTALVFSYLTRKQIEAWARESFLTFNIDENLLSHGIVLFAEGPKTT